MKRYEIMGVVKGAHYELSHLFKDVDIDNRKKAIKIMLGLKNSFNELTYYLSAKIGDTIDVLRTDTVEKMYVMVRTVTEET